MRTRSLNSSWLKYLNILLLYGSLILNCFCITNYTLRILLIGKHPKSGNVLLLRRYESFAKIRLKAFFLSQSEI